MAAIRRRRQLAIRRKMMLRRAAARRRMLALRQRRAALRKAHKLRIARARKTIAVAKRQGWFVRGKSMSFWSSRGAYGLKRRWMARKRQQAARNARARKVYHAKKTEM